MNMPPLATNMHLCCRDANHKHLFLLATGLSTTTVMGGGDIDREGEREREKERRWPTFTS